MIEAFDSIEPREEIVDDCPGDAIDTHQLSLHRQVQWPRRSKRPFRTILSATRKFGQCPLSKSILLGSPVVAAGRVPVLTPISNVRSNHKATLISVRGSSVAFTRPAGPIPLALQVSLWPRWVDRRLAHHFPSALAPKTAHSFPENPLHKHWKKDNGPKFFHVSPLGSPSVGLFLPLSTRSCLSIASPSTPSGYLF